MGDVSAPTHDAEGNGSEHFVQFYDEDAYLLDAVARFIGTALGTGSSGLVIATKPHRQALAERFHARGLDLTAVREQGRYLALRSGDVSAPTHDAEGNGSEHFVQFYDEDAYLLDAVARFIGTALGTGSSGLVIATKPHRQALAERFHARGLDLTAVREQGRYLAL